MNEPNNNTVGETPEWRKTSNLPAAAASPQPCEDAARIDWLIGQALIDFMIEDDNATFDEIGGKEHADAVRAGIDKAISLQETDSEPR